MAVVAPDSVFGTGTHWAFSAFHLFPAADNNVIINGNISGIQEYGDLVIVDGISFYHSNLSANPEQITLAIYTSTQQNTTINHAIATETVAAGITEGRAYYPLGIPSALTNNTLILAMAVDAGITDAMAITAWGRYVAKPSTIEPQEVTVKGVQFFPKRKVSGPV